MFYDVLFPTTKMDYDSNVFEVLAPCYTFLTIEEAKMCVDEYLKRCEEFQDIDQGLDCEPLKERWKIVPRDNMRKRERRVGERRNNPKWLPAYEAAYKEAFAHDDSMYQHNDE